VGVFGKAVFAVFVYFLTPLFPFILINKPIICNPQCSHGTGRKCHLSRIVLQDVSGELCIFLVVVQQTHVQDLTFALAKVSPSHYIGCLHIAQVVNVVRAMLVRYSVSRPTPLWLPPYRHNLRCHPFPSSLMGRGPLCAIRLVVRLNQFAASDLSVNSCDFSVQTHCPRSKRGEHCAVILVRGILA
jgi:hypothetical protein